MVDVDAAPFFIHLPNAYDVRRQAWDVVDACQGALFSVLAREHDGAVPLDGNGGSVPTTRKRAIGPGQRYQLLLQPVPLAIDRPSGV